MQNMLVVLYEAIRKCFLFCRCIALGSSPPLFGIMVIYFHSLPLKRTLFFFITIPVAAIPWCALLFFQLVVPDMHFLSNVSGCAVGTFCKYLIRFWM